MFCARCGKQLDPNSRFCSVCGTAVTAETPGTGYQFHPAGHLTRSRENRMIAGICAGFARHYGWDLNLTRIITCVIILMTGVGALAYLAAWIIIPEEPYAMPVKTA